MKDEVMKIGLKTTSINSNNFIFGTICTERHVTPIVNKFSEYISHTFFVFIRFHYYRLNN